MKALLLLFTTDGCKGGGCEEAAAPDVDGVAGTFGMTLGVAMGAKTGGNELADDVGLFIPVARSKSCRSVL